MRTLFNDAMAEMQEASGRRLYPMGLAAVVGRRGVSGGGRAGRRLGLRGVNIDAATPRQGAPDLGE